MAFGLILAVHIILCLLLIGLVLLQQGKGAEMGATLGGGSNTLFGAGGASGVVIKTTTMIAILFMLTSVLLVRIYNARGPVAGSAADVLQGSLIKEENAPAAASGTPAPAPAANSAPSAPSAPAEAGTSTDTTQKGEDTAKTAGAAVDKSATTTHPNDTSTDTSVGVVQQGAAPEAEAVEASSKASDVSPTTNEAASGANAPSPQDAPAVAETERK
jgi:preprotein translocase subunit SecG